MHWATSRRAWSLVMTGFDASPPGRDGGVFDEKIASYVMSFVGHAARCHTRVDAVGPVGRRALSKDSVRRDLFGLRQSACASRRTLRPLRSPCALDGGEESEVV